MPPRRKSWFSLTQTPWPPKKDGIFKPSCRLFFLLFFLRVVDPALPRVSSDTRSPDYRFTPFNSKHRTSTYNGRNDSRHGWGGLMMASVPESARHTYGHLVAQYAIKVCRVMMHFRQASGCDIETRKFVRQQNSHNLLSAENTKNKIQQQRLRLSDARFRMRCTCSPLNNYARAIQITYRST